MKQREHFASRLGFILISAGCAIGLGNVWRFPYIVGEYGGAAFVLVYLVFLLMLGLPIMAMEFSVGRASQKSGAMSFKTLEKPGSKWHLAGYIGMIGNYILMMFYTTVGGWMLAYIYKTASGAFVGKDQAGVSEVFGNLLANPVELTLWMVITVLLGFFVCSLGLQNGVEKITKVMMSALLVIMLILAVRSVTLGSGAIDGLKFYLMPDFGKMAEKGLGEAIYAALGQSFFTLSIGIGSMAIFGSYISRERSLFGETISICALDTFVAFVAGLIVFPACFSFGVDPGAGPGLVFETLPNIFNQMAGGRIWGSLFFIFMSFAALSTVVAVFENIVSFAMDHLGWSRKKSVAINLILVLVLSMPCVLGFNVLSGFELWEGGNIQDIEDFIVSNNLLPFGSLVYVLFCTTRYGWGWDNFIAECDAGKGIKFPKWGKVYFKYILPVIIVAVFVMGYIDKFKLLG